MSSPGSSRFRFMIPVILMALVACSGGDARTEKVIPGMSRDSAIAVLQSPVDGGPPVATPGSSMNIWHTAQYLAAGKMVEVIWYSGTNEHRTREDTIPAKRVIPIILVDGRVVGVGRDAYKKAAADFTLPPNRY